MGPGPTEGSGALLAPHGFATPPPQQQQVKEMGGGGEGGLALAGGGRGSGGVLSHPSFELPPSVFYPAPTAPHPGGAMASAGGPSTSSPLAAGAMTGLPSTAGGGSVGPHSPQSGGRGAGTPLPELVATPDFAVTFNKVGVDWWQDGKRRRMVAWIHGPSSEVVQDIGSLA